MKSLTERIEVAIVDRLKAAFTELGKPHPTIDVIAWPGRPDTYKLSHPIGACMVIYNGTKYDDSHAMAGQAVYGDAEFEIGILARTLREHQPPQGSASDALGTGAYDFLAVCRQALAGWRVPEAAGHVRVQKDSFTAYKEGEWGYSLFITMPTMTVIDIAEPDEPWMAGDSTLNTTGYVGDGERLGDSTAVQPNPDSPYTPFVAPASIPPDYP